MTQHVGVGFGGSNCHPCCDVIALSLRELHVDESVAHSIQVPGMSLEHLRVIHIVGSDTKS